MKVKDFFKKMTWMQYVYFMAGFCALILAIIGLLLPLLPSTPFGLLAIVCFNRVDPRLKLFCYKIPYLGLALKDWDDHKIIRPKAKWLALGMMGVGLGVVWSRSGVAFWIKLFVSSILLPMMVFIAKRPSRYEK
jgi:uncharacterized membrane protein YbaN (DUF454 family)